MSEPTGARRYGVGGGDAYYDAVRYGGYEGTREQFGKDQAEFAQNAAAVAEAKETVERDAEEVRNTKNTFENTTVPEAIRALDQAGDDQILAITQKGEEVSQQVETVGTEQKDAVANEGRARVQAVEQAGTTQVQNVNDAGTTQVGNVNQAGEDQVDAVEQAGADQVQAVTDEGTTQVGAVNRAGSTQVQAVEDKGDEVLHSIPSDYTELVEDVDNLKESINEVLLPITNYTIGNYTFSTSSGVQEASTTRLCTNLMFLRKGANIKFYPNALQYIYGYYKSDKTSFVASGSWASTNVDFTMPYDGYFEIQFKKLNNATITPEEFTDELIISDAFRNSATALRGCDVVNPDDFTGTDTEKLQAAMNALAATGGSILITRAYTLEGNLTCTHNSNTNRLLRFYGVGNASIEFGSYSVVGGNADHTGAHGGIVFDGLLLLSNGTPRSVMFDGDTLIRIYVRNCCISGFASVVRADSTYIQTVFIDSCVIRSVTSIVVNNNGTQLYDLHISNSVIESCRNVVVSYDSNGIFATNNLIEGLSGTPFSIRNTAHKVLIDGNYFENNGSDNTLIESGATLLALTSANNKEISVTVLNNLIHQSIVGSINKVIVLPTSQVVGQVVIANNFCLAGGMLVSATTDIKHENVLYYCNTTHETEYDQGQYDCNDYVTVITAEMINNLFTT